MIAGKTYYYRLRHRTNRGDLSDFSSVKSAKTLAEASDDNTLQISCICGNRSIANGKAYYKSGDVLSITVISQLPLKEAPTVIIIDKGSNEHSVTLDSSTADYLSNIYSYTVAGTETQGTAVLKASATVKPGETSIKTEENIMLDFVAPTVTGIPIIIDTDDDRIPKDMPYAYRTDKIWIFITDEDCVYDTSGDPNEASGLNKVHLQNAFVGKSTSVAYEELVDSDLNGIFPNNYWNSPINYYLTDSAGEIFKIIDYFNTGTFDLMGLNDEDTPAAGEYYITKYNPADPSNYSNWKNYDVQNRQVLNWDLTIEMPYNKNQIPDTGQSENGGSVGEENAYLDTDHKYKVIARFTDNALNYSNLCSDDIHLDQNKPLPPQNVTATGMLESILLTWQNPGDPALDKINIYMKDNSGICADNKPTYYDKIIPIPNAFADKYMEYTIYFQEPDPQHKYFVLTALDKAGNESICSTEFDATSLAHWGKIFRNWLDNSSFERTVPGDANLPVNLLKSGHPTVNIYVSQYGNNSILVDQNDYYYYDYLYLPASPDTYFFTFSVYARYITNCEAKVEIKFYDSNGDQTGGTVTLLTGDGLGGSLTATFVRYHAHFGVTGNTIPSDATFAKIYFKSDSDTRKVYYDAVQWEQVDAIDVDPTDYVEGRVISGDRMMAHFIRADMMDVDYLSAISANIGLITGGKIQSVDGKTYFDLDNNIIKVYETNDRVIIGKISTNNYGIKAMNASGNILIHIDDLNQLIQSANQSSILDLANNLYKVAKKTDSDVWIGKDIADKGSKDIIMGSWLAQTSPTVPAGEGVLVMHGTSDYSLITKGGFHRKGYEYPIIVNTASLYDGEKVLPVSYPSTVPTGRKLIFTFFPTLTKTFDSGSSYYGKLTDFHYSDTNNIVEYYFLYNGDDSGGIKNADTRITDYPDYWTNVPAGSSVNELRISAQLRIARQSNPTEWMRYQGMIVIYEIDA